MIKTYIADTCISINVVLASKKNLHITFTPLSNGKSTFTTDNEEIINAIERHYNFGALFGLHSVLEEAKKKVAKKVEPTVIVENAPAEEKDADGAVPGVVTEQLAEEDENEEAAEAALKKVTVSDLAAAKDYLADTLGISRTALRSKKAIEEQAAAHGIEFEGLS